MTKEQILQDLEFLDRSEPNMITFQSIYMAMVRVLRYLVERGPDE
jgi:hypothetical protein